MKSKEEVLDGLRDGKIGTCIDGRDRIRLSDFFDPGPDYRVLGVEFKDDVDQKGFVVKPWTKEAIVAQMKEDVAFGFEKALDKRGISASLMHDVVKMWLWILDDPLQKVADDLYEQYGLPLFKAVAMKYGFENRIGENAGNEGTYASEGL